MNTLDKYNGMEDFSEKNGKDLLCKECKRIFGMYSELDRHLNKEHNIIALMGMGIRPKQK